MSLNKWAINKIKFYQKNKLQSGRCRHYPSCSAYGIECYEKFNFVKASFLTLSRIVRCNPLSRKVYDPVPKTKEEKKLAKIALNKELYFKDMLLNEHIKYPNMVLVDDIVFCFVTSFPSVVKPDLINLSYKENLSPTLIRYIFDKPLESTNYNLDNNNYYLITDDLLNKFYTRIDILLLLLKHKEINYHTKYKKLYQEVFNYLTNQKQIVSSCNYLVNAFYIEFVK